MKKLLLLLSIVFITVTAFGQATGYVLPNFASSGSIGTAATTVDVYSRININQTTPSITLSIPNPTNTSTKVTEVWVGNIGTVSFSLAHCGVIDTATCVILKWTGSNYSVIGRKAVTSGSGTVTSVSVVSANGVSGIVSNPTTTPAVTLVLGAITPTSVVASGAISGSNLSGTNTGDQTNITGNAGTVTTNANLTGDVTSVGNATTLSTTSVTAGSYTNTNITVDSKGRLTSASNGTGGGGAPTGPAGGDLAGTYPNPTVAGQVVKSVVLNTPNVIFTNPVTFSTATNTSTGTLALNTQAANTSLMGPISGGSTTPTFRGLDLGDMPLLSGYVAGVGLQTVTSSDKSFTAIQKLDGNVALALSNAGNPLQTETITYINRVKAKSNTYIDAVTIQAIDRFFVVGKANGWLPLMKWMWCPMSTSFDGSLVNLYNVSGVPNEVTNFNFTSGDYNVLSGFGTGINSNSNKYLDLGFTPASIGLSNTNISLGEFIPDASAGNTPAFMFSVNTTSGGGFPPAFSFRSDGANTFSRQGGSGGNSSIGNYAPAILISSFNTGNVYIGYNNGNIAVNSTGTIPGTVALDQNPTFFKTPGYGTYAKGRVGFAFIGSFLTAAQSKSLSDAIRNLMISIGRLNNQGGIAAYVGDSITNGTGSTTVYNRWASIVATNTSLRELNLGVGSSRLNTNIPNGGDDGIVAVINRYLDTETIPINTVFIMIGTNDIGADGTTTGDPTLLSNFTANYTTVLNYYLSKQYNVISIGLPYSTNSTALLRSAYQNATLAVANSLNVKYVDTETLFSDKTNPSSFLTDGTHPNDAGHRLIANQVLEAYRGRLSRNPLVTFGPILTTASSDLTFTVIGAVVGSSVSLGLTTLTNGLLYQAYVSSANTVTIRCINNSISTVTPPSQYISITVLKTN